MTLDDVGDGALGRALLELEHRGLFALGGPALLLRFGDGLELAHLVCDVVVLGVRVAEVLVHPAAERPLGLPNL